MWWREMWYLFPIYVYRTIGTDERSCRQAYTNKRYGVSSKFAVSIVERSKRGRERVFVRSRWDGASWIDWNASLQVQRCVQCSRARATRAESRFWKIRIRSRNRREVATARLFYSPGHTHSIYIYTGCLFLCCASFHLFRFHRSRTHRPEIRARFHEWITI